MQDMVSEELRGGVGGSLRVRVLRKSDSDEWCTAVTSNLQVVDASIVETDNGRMRACSRGGLERTSMIAAARAFARYHRDQYR